jgi:hypothetical protein
MALELYTTITRIDADGDPVECDATVSFTAECISPGYPATYTQPGEGPEYEVTFEDAELETRFCPVPGKLTEAELATLRGWFLANLERAREAARDDGADGFDDERDHANDNGWRGLEA